MKSKAKKILTSAFVPEKAGTTSVILMETEGSAVLLLHLLLGSFPLLAQCILLAMRAPDYLL